MLLAAWAGISVLGMLRADDLYGVRARPALVSIYAKRDPNIAAHLVATFLTSMLIGIAPISAAARASLEWSRTFFVTGRKPGARPLDPPIVGCVAAILLMPLVYLSPPFGFTPTEALIRVAITLLSFFISIGFLLWFFFRNGRRAFAVVGFYIVLSWIVPLGADALMQEPKGTAPTFSLMSPWGTLSNLWDINPSRSWWGLMFQAAAAGGFAVLYFTTQPQQKPGATAPAYALPSTPTQKHK